MNKDEFKKGKYLMVSNIKIQKIKAKTAFIGHISLCRKNKLNAFNLEMFQEIQKALLKWEKDPEIALVIIDSESSKAFSAGGDVTSVRELYLDKGIGVVQDYFKVEYFLDYYLYQFKKPILCWGEGLVMGAGLGIMNPCSHRLVCENTVMAMPENSIGLFPDVGAAYFLNQIDEKIGLFLGLTGIRFSSVDALDWGLADFFIDASDKNLVFSVLLKTDWKDLYEDNHKILSHILNKHQSPIKASKSPWRDEVDFIMEDLDLLLIDKKIKKIFNYKKTSNSVYEKALKSYLKSSPLSKRICFDHFQSSRNKTLREVFVRDWDLVVRCIEYADFNEGVRALLVDKDADPIWIAKSIEEISPVLLEMIFKKSFKEKNKLESAFNEFWNYSI